MKQFIALIAALLISPIAHAANKDKKTDPIKVARDNYREAIKSYMEDIDKNNDGSLSKDEYMASEDDKEAAGKAFDTANKNGDRSLSKTEIGEMLGADKELEKAIDDAKAKEKAGKKDKK